MSHPLSLLALGPQGPPPQVCTLYPLSECLCTVYFSAVKLPSLCFFGREAVGSLDFFACKHTFLKHGGLVVETDQPLSVTDVC